MTSCRLVATNMLSSNPQPKGSLIQCSHPRARQWILEYLKKHGGRASFDELSKVKPSLYRDTSCQCKFIDLLRSADCKRVFLIKEKDVCLMSSYESGLRKMERLLKENGPSAISKLLKEFSKILTDPERAALGINREELKRTICRESTIFTRESATGLVVLRGVHSVLDPSCCHSGAIRWIEQYLKEHAGWAAISEMDLVKSELVVSKHSCKCAIRSLLALPNIRKHFHVKGSSVFTRSYYQSGLQKMSDLLEKNGPQKVDELLRMLKEGEVLSQTEIQALGNNTADLEETIRLAPHIFKPVTRSGTVLLAGSNGQPCRHHGTIKWIMKTLKTHSGWISLEALTAMMAKIPAQDGVCNCDISTILHDDIQRSFLVQGNQVSFWSSCSSTYERGIKKIKDLLQMRGPQPVGILLNMLIQTKTLSSLELKVIGRNKKELSYTIMREPKIFKFESPPGLVMLRNTRHEDSNQVTKVVDYLERYLRTCKSSSVKTLLKEVVRHESLSTGCVSGKDSLRKLLAAHPDSFLTNGDGSISLTKSRQIALSDTSSPCTSKRKGKSENESRTSVSETRHVQCPMEVTLKGAHSSSTKDVNSSNSKPLNISDGNNNYEVNSGIKDRESTHETGQSESYRDLIRALKFVKQHLETNGPMFVKHIHASIVATYKLDGYARRTLGRTPEELLSVLLWQKHIFHVIPPNDLVVLCHTSQMRVNPWTTGLEKVQEYLRKNHPLSDLVDFVRKNLTPRELQVFGASAKQVKRTLASYQDIFENRDGKISLRSSADKGLASNERKEAKNKRKSKDSAEKMDASNPCKKVKTDPLVKSAPQVKTDANAVVVQVVETADEWLQLCHSLFDSASSVVGIDCDSKWFVLRRWDGKVIATPIHQPHTSNKPGDIFYLLSLLLNSSTILKVVYDVQRICAVLCLKMSLSVDNVFDIKVANQVIRRENPSSHMIPDGKSFTELCKTYGVVPSALVHVSCRTPGRVDATDEAILKNMAVMTCSLIPHFMHKMFRDIKLELLTEHNCIVEELIKACGTCSQPERFLPMDPIIPSVQEQERSLTNLQVPSHANSDPRLAGNTGWQRGIQLPKDTIIQQRAMTSMQLPNPDNAILCVRNGTLHDSVGTGLQPLRNLTEYPHVPSVPEQQESLTSLQVPNHGHADPHLHACNTGKQLSNDCNLPSDLEQTMPLTEWQVPNPNNGNHPLLHRDLLGKNIPMYPNIPSVQVQQVSSNSMQIPNLDHADPLLPCNCGGQLGGQSFQEHVMPSTSMQMPSPDNANSHVIHGVFCDAIKSFQRGQNLPKHPK